MADYKDIVGTAVRNNAGTLTSAKTGELFYDSTNLDFKYQFPATTTAWRTGPNDVSPTPRFYVASAGTATSAITGGGEGNPASPAIRAESETWNGTAFTAISSLNTAKYSQAGCGTSTAAAVAGGYTGSNTSQHEVWNGSSWTETTDINTARRFIFGSGASPAFLVSGGYVSSDSA